MFLLILFTKGDECVDRVLSFTTAPKRAHAIIIFETLGYSVCSVDATEIPTIDSSDDLYEEFWESNGDGRYTGIVLATKTLAAVEDFGDALAKAYGDLLTEINIGVCPADTTDNEKEKCCG